MDNEVSDLDNFFSQFEGSQREMLIPILEMIQDSKGYIPEEAIVRLSRILKIPASKVFGVATFYDHFHFEPRARYKLKICNGTACHVHGAGSIVREIEQHLNLKAGQATRDYAFSLELAPCMGACSVAPVLMLNDSYFAGIDSKKAKELIDNCKRK